MNRLLLAALVLSSNVGAAVAPSLPQPLLRGAAPTAGPVVQGRRYVSASVRGSLRDRWDVSDHQGRLWLNISAMANSVHFSGRPISGSMFGGPSSWSISGGSVSGGISRWGGGMSVNATMYRPSPRRVHFTLSASGPANDPNRPPSLSLHSMDASLNFTPSFNGYSLSGMIDEERFGDEGLAVACLAASLVLKEAQAKRGGGLPKADWLQKSPLLAPLLKK
ncbi:MAG: hypothetical protein HYZ75_08950 [Elusimicrobia bacterium]|nr:hypothetical protein [Elusimicrobiota bacterium]